MTARVWTPFFIEVMLHHTCSTAPFSRNTAPAYQECKDMLLRFGLLELQDDETTILATEKGKALVELWCCTPIPEAIWIDPRLKGDFS